MKPWRRGDVCGWGVPPSGAAVITHYITARTIFFLRSVESTPQTQVRTRTLHSSAWFKSQQLSQKSFNKNIQMIIISLCIRLFFPHTLSAFSVSCFFAAQYHDLQAATVSRTLEKSEKTELRRARDYGGNRFSSAHRCTNGFHPPSKPIVDSQSYAFLVTIICLSFFF